MKTWASLVFVLVFSTMPAMAGFSSNHSKRARKNRVHPLCSIQKNLNSARPAKKAISRETLDRLATPRARRSPVPTTGRSKKRKSRARYRKSRVRRKRQNKVWPASSASVVVGLMHEEQIESRLSEEEIRLPAPDIESPAVAQPSRVSSSPRKPTISLLDVRSRVLTEEQFVVYKDLILSRLDDFFNYEGTIFTKEQPEGYYKEKFSDIITYVNAAIRNYSINMDYDLFWMREFSYFFMRYQNKYRRVLSREDQVLIGDLTRFLSERLVFAIRHREDVVEEYPYSTIGKYAFGPQDIIAEELGNIWLPPIRYKGPIEVLPKKSPIPAEEGERSANYFEDFDYCDDYEAGS